MQLFLYGGPQSTKSRKKALELFYKLWAQLESGYGFKNGEPPRFQKQKGIEFTSVSSSHFLLWRERGECQDRSDETQRPRDRDQEWGKETTYSNSPSCQSHTFHPTSNSLPILPLKLQSKTHCRCDIIFPDNWTLWVNDFPSFQRGNNFVLLNVIIYCSPFRSLLWPKAKFQRSSASPTQPHMGKLLLVFVNTPLWILERWLAPALLMTSSDNAQGCRVTELDSARNKDMCLVRKQKPPRVSWWPTRDCCFKDRVWEMWAASLWHCLLPESQMGSGTLLSFSDLHFY